MIVVYLVFKSTEISICTEIKFTLLYLCCYLLIYFSNGVCPVEYVGLKLVLKLWMIKSVLSFQHPRMWLVVSTIKSSVSDILLNYNNRFIYSSPVREYKFQPWFLYVFIIILANVSGTADTPIGILSVLLYFLIVSVVKGAFGFIGYVTLYIWVGYIKVMVVVLKTVPTPKGYTFI